MAGEKLQDGIYYRSDSRPAPCLRLLFLNFDKNASRVDARQALEAIWLMLDELKQGVVRDLRPMQADDPRVRVPAGSLDVLIGFGVRLFETRSHATDWLRPGRRPSNLGPRLLGGVGRPFPSLHWSTTGSSTAAQTDVVLQFGAQTQLAVQRAIVEVDKLIQDESLPIEIKSFYDGFQRDDGRSWIDFHDGINNMSESERAIAMEALGLDSDWMEGGTFLAFLRIAVDLAAWRRLDRIEQEILVGRTKLTGCPLESVERRDGTFHITTVDGCPVSAPPLEDFSGTYRDPPRAADPLVRASHIHRSNHNRGHPGQDSNNRVYRQGYEFLEPDGAGRPRLGLNFLGFQRNMRAIRNILRIQSWMGAVNFGGPSQADAFPAPIRLMSLEAGGFFAIPPVGLPFPGADLFQ